jgi:transcriptional regulator with XRE-family HTH domain
MLGGRLIREARRRAGLSQAELADRLRTSQSVVARWETGRRAPTLETVVETVQACGFELGFTLTPADAHDRVLIRRCLGQTPADRLTDLVAAVSAFDRMTTTAKAHRG